jgi:hypothetical protein
MVLHSGPEERLLAGGSAPGQQGENYILDESRAMTVHDRALDLCNTPVMSQWSMETVLRGLT